MKPMFIFGFLLIGVFGGANAEGKIWALLAAGSNGFINYRHQADIFHAYHVLTNHGITKENIIVMAYDDIADNPENPHKGKVFNRPNGIDVYAGVSIDYRGDTVNPDNWLAVLQGQKDKVKGGNGRVIESTENDKVFVYFADHGNPGIIYFPNDKEATKKQLDEALRGMHKDKKFKELVFYLETCHSGSMFNAILPTDINIYAITAADPDQSSHPCYCDSELVPDTCLGDEFSVHWMENSDSKNLHKETLQEQFEFVKSHTKQSTVLQYGDLNIAKEVVSHFQGEKDAPQIEYDLDDMYDYEMWPVSEVSERHLKSKLKRASYGSEERSLIYKQLEELRQQREFVDKHIKGFVKSLNFDSYEQEDILNENPQIIELNCHHDVVTSYKNVCPDLKGNEFSNKYVKVLANLCEHQMEAKEILSKLEKHCKN